MKIIIGMTRSDTTMSGSFKHICQIGECFRNKGVDVVYILGGTAGPAIDVIESKGFKVLKLGSLGREINPIKDFWSLIQLFWILLKERPDITSWHTAKIGAIGRVASSLLRIKSFYVPHGVPFINTPENKGFKKFERLEKLLSYLPGTIIGVCEFDRNEYLRIGVNPNKVIAIPNGMEGMKASQIKVSDSKPVKFITAARFEEQKDYTSLYQACEILVKAGLEFTLDIYGDGTKEVEVKAMFSKLPAGVASFKGVVSNFAEELVKADVFVLSSFWEGLPRSIIEAMACEKAVIASDVGGCSELIIQNENGFLVPKRSPTKLSQAMSFYINNRADITLHSELALAKYNREFTLEKMLQTYCSVYGLDVQ